jgi:hypothetical protein
MYVRLAEIYQLPTSEATTKQVRITHAIDTGIEPDAIGLFFFLGCSLSSDTSIISLRIYTELAAKENRMNAIKL